MGNCSYLIVWLVGEFDCSLYWYLRLREVYFVPSGAVRNWKDFKHNALGPFGHLHFANSMLWRRLSSTPRRSVCNIDCGRRKGMWKYPYPVDAIHNTMSKRSLGFYTLLSMVECILSTWGCGCANEAHHEKSYCGMYFISAYGGFSAGLKRFGHRNFLNWTTCCRMMHSHRNLVWESDAWAECHCLSLTFYTVITFRDDVVPYYGAWGSISRTLTICRQWSRWLTLLL